MEEVKSSPCGKSTSDNLIVAPFSKPLAQTSHPLSASAGVDAIKSDMQQKILREERYKLVETGLSREQILDPTNVQLSPPVLSAWP